MTGPNDQDDPMMDADHEFCRRCDGLLVVDLAPGALDVKEALGGDYLDHLCVCRWEEGASHGSPVRATETQGSASQAETRMGASPGPVEPGNVRTLTDRELVTLSAENWTSEAMQEWRLRGRPRVQDLPPGEDWVESVESRARREQLIFWGECLCRLRGG